MIDSGHCRQQLKVVFLYIFLSVRKLSFWFQMEQNEPDCIEINLNNIQGICQETWLQFFATLARNSTVELLSATNCDLTDTIGAAISQCLEQNK